MQCLQFELASHKLRFTVQRPIPIVYKGHPLDASYRIDLIVEDLVVVEVKSVAESSWQNSMATNWPSR